MDHTAFRYRFFRKISAQFDWFYESRRIANKQYRISFHYTYWEVNKRMDKIQYMKKKTILKQIVFIWIPAHTTHTHTTTLWANLVVTETLYPYGVWIRHIWPCCVWVAMFVLSSSVRCIQLNWNAIAVNSYRKHMEMYACVVKVRFFGEFRHRV